MEHQSHLWSGSPRPLTCICYYQLLFQRHGTSVTSTVGSTKANHLCLLLPPFIPTPWNFSDNSGQEHQGQSLPFATTNLYSNAMEHQLHLWSGSPRPLACICYYHILFQRHGTSLTPAVGNTKAMHCTCYCHQLVRNFTNISLG
jgi:hypothetical protein